MILTLKRKWPSFSCVVGQLFIDGVPECYTLEDMIRPGGDKIPGRTAIPEGTYHLTMSYSKRFCRDLPLLLEVPNFSAVRIHAGNTCEDTAGCILVGCTRGDASIGKSRLALETVLLKIKDACNAGQAMITVEGAAEGDPTYVKSSSGDRIG